MMRQTLLRKTRRMRRKTRTALTVGACRREGQVATHRLHPMHPGPSRRNTSQDRQEGICQDRLELTRPVRQSITNLARPRNHPQKTRARRRRRARHKTRVLHKSRPNTRPVLRFTRPALLSAHPQPLPLIQTSPRRPCMHPVRLYMHPVRLCMHPVRLCMRPVHPSLRLVRYRSRLLRLQAMTTAGEQEHCPSRRK